MFLAVEEVDMKAEHNSVRAYRPSKCMPQARQLEHGDEVEGQRNINIYRSRADEGLPLFDSIEGLKLPRVARRA